MRVHYATKHEFNAIVLETREVPNRGYGEAEIGSFRIDKPPLQSSSFRVRLFGF